MTSAHVYTDKTQMQYNTKHMPIYHIADESASKHYYFAAGMEADSAE